MYQNPKKPEGINTSKEHPLKEFSILLVGTIALVILASFILGFSGSWLAGKVPFSAETKIAGIYDISQHTDSSEFPKITEYLQALADKISKAQNLPEEMTITAHYMDNETVNAFATIGGNLFIYRGLLELVPDENTLVTLLGHEIAHVKYRHPIKSLGRGVAVSIAMSTITGSTDSQVLGDTGLLTVLKFSRDMELQADEEAMNTLKNLYDHINGGAQLFQIFQDIRIEMDEKEEPEIFSTHPLDQHRIDNFSVMAQKNNWSETGTLTPLPDFFIDRLNDTKIDLDLGTE